MYVYVTVSWKKRGFEKNKTVEVRKLESLFFFLYILV